MRDMKESKRVRVSTYLLVYGLILGVLSCSQSLSQEEYMAWVEDYENGLHIAKTLGDFSFDLQYKPTQYVLFQEGVSPEGENLSVDDNMQYYTLVIGLNNKNIDFIDSGISEQERAEKLYYYSYLFQNDIYLEENGQRLPCLLFHFERSYDLKTSRTFVLAFDNPNPGSKKTQFVIDSPWLNVGPVKFYVDKNNIPELKPPVNAS